MARRGAVTRPGARDSAASRQTQQALIEATIETLKTDGFAGASARAIAARAESNQALVFYHFGSVANLLLAALDAVSEARFARYREAAEQESSVSGLIAVAHAIFEEDLDTGYATVLVELIAGARSIPGFGAEIAARIAPWATFAEQSVDRAVDPMLLAATAPPAEIAYAIVALYAGLELLAGLDGDRTKARALFSRLDDLVALLDTLGVLPPVSRSEDPS